ncbi:MAG: regulatory protein RecX [Saccharofermentanales bacterium]|nr:RecX family transcriptional regulator [Clostridiaceae bacterium]
MTDFESVREAAVTYIGIDFYKSSGSVRRNLLKKGASEALIEDVIRYLKEIDYIDDFRAAQRVTSRYRGKRLRSRRAMIEIFRRNGIEYEDAKRAASALGADEDTALELLEASFSVPAEASDFSSMRKLLFRRGYSEGTARRAIDSFFERSHLD